MIELKIIIFTDEKDHRLDLENRPVHWGLFWQIFFLHFKQTN